MKTQLSYRWLVGAFAALFIILQSYSLSHASAYGDGHHEHDGVACTVTVLADEQAALLPVIPVFETVETTVSETLYPNFTSALYLTPLGRAPPPRGPPASI